MCDHVPATNNFSRKVEMIVGTRSIIEACVNILQLESTCRFLMNSTGFCHWDFLKMKKDYVQPDLIIFIFLVFIGKSLSKKKVFTEKNAGIFVLSQTIRNKQSIAHTGRRKSDTIHRKIEKLSLSPLPCQLYGNSNRGPRGIQTELDKKLNAWISHSLMEV